MQPLVEFETLETLEPAPNQTIRGETPLEAGETVFVILDLTDGFASDTPAVEDGTFEAGLDLQSAAGGSEFDLIVRREGDEVGETTGSLGYDEADSEIDLEPVNDGVTFDYEGDQLEIERAPEQQITGESEFEPGETILVRLRSRLHSR